eukprot:205062-Hanusia_phi.AAC.3
MSVNDYSLFPASLLPCPPARLTLSLLPSLSPSLPPPSPCSLLCWSLVRNLMRLRSSRSQFRRSAPLPLARPCRHPSSPASASCSSSSHPRQAAASPSPAPSREERPSPCAQARLPL